MDQNAPSLDEARWTAHHTLLILATATTIVLDGVDNQLLPNAIPTLIAEWGQPRPAFTTALAIGPFGMMVGGMLGGLIGDRVGRRPALLGSVIAFGAFTAALALANSIETIAVLRFLAGLGLGGAMPNAATLASEYVPLRYRPVAVTLTIVSIPIGGVLAGEIAAALIPAQGWRVLFAVCGAASMAIAAVLWLVLPESPRFLAPGAQHASGAKLLRLFQADTWRDSTAICSAFFFNLMTNYVIVLLLPAMLTSTAVGYSQPTASRGLAMWNYGGVLAALLGALAVQRVGSRVAMVSMGAVGVIGAAVLSVLPLDPTRTTWLLVLILLTGAGVNGVQITMYAVAAHIYPTEIRSTGIGTAVAIGRIGNVVAAYAGSTAIDLGGPGGYFMMCAAFMLVVVGSLSCITRHVPAEPK